MKTTRWWGELGLMGATTFLGAFLLFQVQPIMGKALLPWFGGGSSVWIGCLLFFQVALLLGYLYAHLVAQIKSPWVAIFLHTSLTVWALASLPIMPSATWKSAALGDPVWGITTLLLAHIGVAYVLLASTSPLLHFIFHRTHPDRSPYRLYALSNLGSLLALIGYPFLIEPFVSLHVQGFLWALGLTLFSGLMLSVSWVHWRRISQPTEAGPEPFTQAGLSRPGLSILTWLLLASIPSALLMVTTTHLCTNIAPIPFIWIGLLAAYLISFIFAFDHPRWYSRRVFYPLFFLAVFVMALFGSEQRAYLSVWLTIPVTLVAFFVICMVMHGELARLKPLGRWITWFFLTISAGGAIGGTSIAVISPWVSNARYDYSVVLGIGAMVPIALLLQQRSGALNHRWVRIGLLTASGLASVFAFAVTGQLVAMVHESVVATRNFYGTLRVVEEGVGEDRSRSLIDGVIDHGAQFTNPPRDKWVTTYYGTNTGIEMAMKAVKAHGNLRVGVIGLGVGTLAWYGESGDTFDFVEINPDVVGVANHQFTFLSRSKAKINILLGDGRLAFENLPQGQYDLIAVDAFTSDSVPVHLLTREAFELYFSRLKADGLLCVNISNRYLNLRPVVEGASRAFGWEPWTIQNSGDLGKGLTGSTWMVVGNPGFPQGLKEIRQAGHSGVSKPVLWTDDHSSLAGLLRFKSSSH